MSAGRSRFVTTVDTMRAIFREIAAAGGVPGLESIASNPVEEDTEPGCDRIHALHSGNVLSEVAIVAMPGKVVLERLKGRGVSEFPSYDIPLAAAAFVSELRMEMAGPQASASEVRRPEATAAAVVAQRIEKARSARQQLPEPRRTSPKARFRETTVAVSLVRAAASTIEGIRDFEVNPGSLAVERDEDRLHAILEDGTVSKACLFCGPGSYAISDGRSADELPLAVAAQAFIASVRMEALAETQTMRRQ